MFTRRHFLASQVSGALLSVVPGLALGRFLTPSTKENLSLAELSLSLFKNLANQPFTIQFEENSVLEALLVEVLDRHSTPSIEQFSLILSVKQEHPFSQGMYSVSNAEIGSFELFLVPISSKKGEVRYEAAFNRIKDIHAPPM